MQVFVLHIYVYYVCRRGAKLFVSKYIIGLKRQNMHHLYVSCIKLTIVVTQTGIHIRFAEISLFHFTLTNTYTTFCIDNTTYRM